MDMKRCFDLVAASIGLALISPLFLIIGLAVKLDSPGPVFFRQVRVGKAEVPFRIFKFRSMFNCAQMNGYLVTASGDPRVTRVGHLLRKWKLDELPQLINVIIGDMSLVRPRAEVPKFVEFYTPNQRAILYSVKPGMTDFASITFLEEEKLLSNVPDPEKLYREVILPTKYKLYEQYISDSHFWLDIWLIAMTIAKIVRSPKR